MRSLIPAQTLLLPLRRALHWINRGDDGSENTWLLVLAVIVGAAGGYGAVAFRALIGGFHHLFFVTLRGPLSFMGDAYVLVLPALGGALVGPLVYFLAREAKGHGVPEVMDAVARRGGVIRPRVVIVKSLASSICIGSGGSVGREGPIVQIGSALGSAIGQLLRLDRAKLRSVVACGAAAGVAATSNAPLVGAFFALEVILVEWGAEAFAPVVAASVTAAAIGRSHFGDIPTFAVPPYALSAFSELPLFFLLGLVCACGGVFFTRTRYYIEDLWNDVRLPQWLLPVIGGLMVGTMGLLRPEVFGVGYEAIQRVLTDRSVGILLPLILFGSKLVATSMTIGSGGSGGVFAPSLFMGAMLGAALGAICHALFPFAQTSPGAYALVGMAALFAATSHAPITAVLIVFELTMDYRLILPLMLACGVSTITARLLFRFSIYNLKLVRRGIHVTLRQDTALLNRITVAAAMTQDVLSVPPEMPLEALQRRFEETKHHGFPVVDAAGRLRGLVTIGDVQRAIRRGGVSLSAIDIATHDLIVCFPDETLNDALRKLGLKNVGRLPVVDRDDHQRLLGLITRKNIIAAYNRALLAGHTRLEETLVSEHFD